MIPIVSEEVCEIISLETIKDGTIWLRIAPHQEHLQYQWLMAYMQIGNELGLEAAESALRLSMLTYKAIESQMEVNDLECM